MVIALDILKRPMPIHPADLSRLILLIQRLLDAEVLCQEDGTELLSEAEAGRRSLQAGDAEAVREHLERVARFTETLVRTNALAPGDGHAVLESVRLLLGEETDRPA